MPGAKRASARGNGTNEVVGHAYRLPAQVCGEGSQAPPVLEPGLAKDLAELVRVVACDYGQCAQGKSYLRSNFAGACLLPQ